MTEAIGRQRERAKAAETRIKEFRVGGREVSLGSQPRSERGGSDESMDAEVPDSCAGAAQEPMEDDAEDRMEKQKRASGWEDTAERTKRPRKDDDDEDMLLEVACQDDFDEAGWAEEFVDGQEVAARSSTRRRCGRPGARNWWSSSGGSMWRRTSRSVKVTGKKPIQVRLGGRRQGLRFLPEQACREGFQAEEQDRRPRGTLRREPAAGGREVPHHAGRDQLQAGVVRKVMLIDISKAHLYAPIEGEQYVDLAPERAKAGKCAKLPYTLYGLWIAASSWEREYSQTLEADRFVLGTASKCTFVHPARTIRIVLQGDDFVIEGGQEDLDWTGPRECSRTSKVLGEGEEHPRPGTSRTTRLPTS